MNNSKAQWHLLGAGALGCLFAAYLQRANVTLELIVRNEAALRQLQANAGITLTDNGDQNTFAIAATTPHSLTATITQLVICTKAQQTLEAVLALKNKIAPDALIVLLQNGMGVHELLREELPRAVFLHALSTEGTFRTAPFHITHAGHGETIIGAIDTREASRAHYAVQALQCGLPIIVAGDIEKRLWLKLAVNSVINPLTALHRCRNGELLQLPNIDRIVVSLCEELAHVAQAENIELNAADMRNEVFRVINATALNKSSMLQDIDAHRSTEIDFINGFIVRRARLHNLPCPQHQYLLTAVRAIES